MTFLPAEGQASFGERHAGRGWRAWMRSEVGLRRARLEDAWRILPGASMGGGLWDAFAVFDGLGGRPLGQEAAWAAANGLAEAMRRAGEPAGLLRELDGAVQGTGGATTATVALLGPGEDAWVVGVGDSSAYVLEDGKPRLVLPKDRASRGVLTDCLGTSFAGGHQARQPLAAGQSLLLCTDGVDEVAGPAALVGVLAAPPARVAAELDALFALVRAEGAPDNATALLVRRTARPARPLL